MKKLVLLFTNDLHANLENLRVLRESVIDRIRDEATVLLFDCGDFIEGTVYAFYKKGTAILDLMKECGYSGIMLGNHEFTCGLEGLTSLMEEMEKRELNVVCSNLSLMGEYRGEPHWRNIWENLQRRIHPYLLIDIGDPKVRVGVLGLLGEKVFAPETWPAEFKLDVGQLRTLVACLKSQGAEIIVTLFHGSIEEAKRLIEQVEGIDFLLCGHSHTVFLEVHRQRVIAEAGAFGEFLGILEFEFDKMERTIEGYITSRIVRVNKVSEFFQEITREKQKYISQIENDILKAFPELTGRNLEEEIPPELSSLKNIGYAIVDTIRRETCSDVAFVSLGENPLLLPRDCRLRISDLFKLGRGGVPYNGILGGTLCKFYLTLQELKTILEATVCAYKEKGLDVLLIPSGLRITFDSNRPFFARIVKLELFSECGSEVLYNEGNWCSDPNRLLSVSCSLISLFGMRKLSLECSKLGLIAEEILPRKRDGRQVRWEKIEDLRSFLHHGENGEPKNIWNAVLKFIWETSPNAGGDRIVDVSGKKILL